DHDLVAVEIEVVVALELGDDGLAQAGRAGHRRVFRLAGVERLLGRVLDVFRRVEIRFAGAQADDVVAGGFHFRRAGGDGQGWGRFYALDAVCEFNGHGV